MMFLENPEDMEVTRIMEENENIKEAKEELDRISQDDLLSRMALKADFERMDKAQMLYEAKRDGRAEGRTSGLKDGKAIGKAMGAKEKQIEIARNMLQENMKIEVIAKVTGLRKEEIEKEVES